LRRSEADLKLEDPPASGKSRRTPQVVVAVPGFPQFSKHAVEAKALEAIPEASSINRAAGDKKGKWVKDRIMEQEADWVRHRTFFCSQQGRHPKHLDKLLDEGTIPFLWAYLAESKEAITAQKLYLHVSLLFIPFPLFILLQIKPAASRHLTLGAQGRECPLLLGRINLQAA
jgi:hypothetical protein